jgi:hypothetical protein
MNKDLYWKTYAAQYCGDIKLLEELLFNDCEFANDVSSIMYLNANCTPELKKSLLSFYFMIYEW